MKKRIPVEELQVGMYVAELDRGGPFPGLRISSQAQLDKLKRYCRYVYIDVPEEPPGPSTLRPASGRWPSLAFSAEQQQRIEFELLKLGAAPSAPGAPYPDQTTTEQEMAVIPAPYEALRDLLRATLAAVEHGEPLKLNALVSAAMPIAESAIRNADAIMCFAQLRRKADFVTLHSLRALLLALALGRQIGLPVRDLVTLGVGALLMDIGKQKLPDEILNKPASLTESEYEVAKGHVAWGAQLLRATPGIPEPVTEMAYYHHERYDGSGYPQGLRHKQIPYLARIGGIIDCYDALTSDRPYADAVSAYNALKKLYEMRGRFFDPKLAEQFIQCMGVYPIGSVVELNTGDIGVVLSVNRTRRLRPRVRLVLRSDKSAYRPPQVINLTEHTTTDGRPFAIEHVLEPGAYGIRPANYLDIPLRH